MFAAALIVFREVFEAGLVIGIVMSATRLVPGRGRWIAGGVLAGLAGAAGLAAFAGTLADALEGVGQEVFNAGVLGIAAMMLAWHTLWMARHGREIAGEMKALGQAVAAGRRTLTALSVVVGVAVLREGAEVVLFLYGIAVSAAAPVQVVGGGIAGLLGGAAIAVLLYRGLVAIPTRRLFAVTNTLLTLMAAGLAASAVGYLVTADLAPAWGEVWNISWLLPQKSLAGQALHALVGYMDRPTGSQIVTYAVVLAVLTLSGMRFARPVTAVRAAA